MSDVKYEKVLPAIYEGKASNLYAVKGYPEFLIIERKDDITAGNGEKHDVIQGKGALCNQISNILFKYVYDNTSSTTTHLVEELSDNETVIEKATPIKLEVVVRNIATGSIIKRLPFDDKQELDVPVVELYYKDDAAGDPFLNETEAMALGVLEKDDEYDDIKECALEVNEVLQELFAECDITLVDMKLEFGRDENGGIFLIDEISPDTCRLWDTETGRKLGKDIYRNGGSAEELLAAYQEVLHRLEEVVVEDEDDEEDNDDEEDEEEDANEEE